MCCASASRVNAIQEAVKYKYGKVEIGMPVFMGDIVAVGTAGNIRKGIQNCRMMDIDEKMIYGLKRSNQKRNQKKQYQKEQNKEQFNKQISTSTQDW